MKPLGLILAGGLARRMGGGDKPLREVAGRPLLSRVIERLAPQTAALALNANGDPARFDGFGLPVVADGVPDFPGPLAGVLAGMEFAASRGLLHVLTAAGDTPFLPADLGARLGAALSPDTPVALAAGPDGARHPTFGLWPAALAPELRAALGAGARKVSDWADRQGAAAVRFDDRPFDPFFNVNRPEDIEAAERIAREHGL